MEGPDFSSVSLHLAISTLQVMLTMEGEGQCCWLIPPNPFFLILNTEIDFLTSCFDSNDG